jgi:hypothetical protein
VTPVGLRQAAVGYPVATIRSAVEAGLRECPLPDVPPDPHFADLVVFWLMDPDRWEGFPPPLTEAQVAAIHRHLVASGN